MAWCSDSRSGCGAGSGAVVGAVVWTAVWAVSGASARSAGAVGSFGVAGTASARRSGTACSRRPSALRRSGQPHCSQTRRPLGS